MNGDGFVPGIFAAAFIGLAFWLGYAFGEVNERHYVKAYGCSAYLKAHDIKEAP